MKQIRIQLLDEEGKVIEEHPLGGPYHPIPFPTAITVEVAFKEAVIGIYARPGWLITKKED